MTHLWRFLYPNCPRWVDIYITDASVSMLSIQLLEHTYDPPMEIPIPELPSLGRHIYHRCVSLYAEHTKLEHTCAPGMEIPIPELPSLGRHIYHRLLEIPIPELPSLGHRCVNLYAKHTIIVCPSILWRFTDASVSMLNIQLLQLTYVPGMELSIPKLPSLGRHIYHRCLSLYAEHKIIGTPMSQVWRFLYPNYRHWVDMYITDTSGSRLRIKLLEHNYVPAMEIPIPELQSLARHIYRRRVSLCAEHTLI